jgi:hypothetical protein
VGPFQSLLAAVGQDKDSFPLVGRTNFSRAKYSPRRSETHFFQITDDCGESQRNVSFDVFEEDPAGSAKMNSLCNVGPQVAWVVCTASCPGCTEWLARVPGSEQIHSSTKTFVREGFGIRKDRSRSHFTRFNLCNQVDASLST